MGVRGKAVGKAVKAMRDLGYVEATDEPLVAELTELAGDLDTIDHENYLYPQLLRLYHETEERCIGRLLPHDDGDGPTLTLEQRVAAMGHGED